MYIHKATTVANDQVYVAYFVFIPVGGTVYSTTKFVPVTEPAFVRAKQKNCLQLAMFKIEAIVLMERIRN